MKDKSSYIHFEPNDFIIRISPDIDDDGEWTGDIEVGMLTTDYNDLNDDDYSHLNILTQMLISAIEVMETDVQVRNKLFNAMDQHFKKHKAEEETSVIEEREGNVIKVKF